MTTQSTTNDLIVKREDIEAFLDRVRTEYENRNDEKLTPERIKNSIREQIELAVSNPNDINIITERVFLMTACYFALKEQQHGS